jgi:general secretion pathway protein J
MKTSPSARYGQDSGFTLLEVLVAMLLLVILSGALYGTFFSLTRGRDAATAGMESRREVRTTLDMLRRELSSVWYAQGDKRLHFVVEDRDSFGRPASTLDFTTLFPPRSDSVPSSDQVAVRYQVVERDKENGKGNRLELTREVKDLYLTAKAIPYPQMEELEGFLVECYDRGKWVKSWDTAINMGLPKAVRVTIRLREGDSTVEFATTASPRVTGR